VLTTHLLLAPRSGKSRAIPLPPLWAFGPVTGYLFLLIVVMMMIMMMMMMATMMMVMISTMITKQCKKKN
jgi:hypothetical protein